MSAAELSVIDGWDERDDRRIAEHMARLQRQRSAIFPFGPDGPRAHVSHGIYNIAWSDSGVSIDFDYLVTDRYGETSAEMCVTWTDPLDPLALLRSRVNLISLTARDRHAAALSKRTTALKLDWTRMLDQACRWVMEQYRRGDPGGLLRDAGELSAADELLTDPALLEGDGATLLFGDGGSGKSLTALALAAALQSGTAIIEGVTTLSTRRVGYVDWEWSARRHRRRLEQLAGPDMPEIAYIRCTRPIHEERDRLRRFVRDYGLDYAVFDSVGLACGGEPESAEVASRFVNAASDLFPAWLGIAHVTKAAADRAPDKPFGSAFWHNAARRTWYARGVSEPGSAGMRVGLYNKKANDGPLAAPFALSYEWADDRVSIARTELRDVPELDATRGIPARIRDLLGRHGAMELHAIAAELGEKVDSVKKAATRDLDKGRLTRFAGPDGVYRWGLPQ